MAITLPEIGAVMALLEKSGVARQGCELSEEAAGELVQDLYPNKSFCLVRNWKLINIDAPADDLASFAEAGLIPVIIYASNVRWDSQGRFPKGGWVRSTPGVAHKDFFFETRNTVYVLLGEGFEQTQRPEIFMSIF